MTEEAADLTTVTDVLRRLGISESAVDKSTLGRVVALTWRTETGKPPSFRYGPKADGSGGYHSLAAYPAEFVPTVERLIHDALTSSREELERRAPRPRRVEQDVQGKRAVKDVTPPGGSFWFGDLTSP